MSGVQTVTVRADDADQRLDRWFKRYFPNLNHGRLEKLLRTGQIRVDGKRAKANTRLDAGQVVRVPPLPETLPEAAPQSRRIRPTVDPELAKLLEDRILHIDDDFLVIDKPAGLAVQGGTGITRSVDGALDALVFGKPDRPKLVHRLDRDTSGVLVLARTTAAARWAATAFRQKTTRKVYWSLVVGEVKIPSGRISLSLSKQPGKGGEKMTVDETDGQRAVTEYRVREQLGTRVAWVELYPVTGRTHQLRVHMAETGTPILGDGKYGGEGAFLVAEGLSRKLHLHARAISMPRLKDDPLIVEAPLPDHMVSSWDFFGFESPSIITDLREEKL